MNALASDFPSPSFVSFNPTSKTFASFTSSRSFFFPSPLRCLSHFSSPVPSFWRIPPSVSLFFVPSRFWSSLFLPPLSPNSFISAYLFQAPLYIMSRLPPRTPPPTNFDHFHPSFLFFFSPGPDHNPGPFSSRYRICLFLLF